MTAQRTKKKANGVGGVVTDGFRLAFLSNLTRPGCSPVKTDSYFGVPVTYNVSPVYTVRRLIEVLCSPLSESQGRRYAGCCIS